MRKRGLAMLMAGIMIISSCVMGCAKDNGKDTPAETAAAASETAAAASETAAQSETEGSETTKQASEGAVKGDINGDGIFKVGFSELAIDGAWRVAQVDSMQNEAESRGYEFVMSNAELDTAKQISDVEDLLTQDLDFLFIAPIDMEAIMPAIEAAKAKGVPTILLDREANGTPGVDYICTILSNYIWQGEACADWLNENGGADSYKIVQITGKVGGSDVRDRQAGFETGVKKYENMEIVATQSGEWSRTEAQKVMQNIIQSTGGDFNVVYCHNDEMALGVVLALKAAGMNPGTDVKVIAIDGQAEAVEAIIAGEMNCIATCNPRFGPVAFDTMEKYLNGEKLEHIINNEEYIIDTANAEEKLPDAFEINMSHGLTAPSKKYSGGAVKL